MDRKQYKMEFTKDQLPDWICPKCQKSVLQFLKDTLHFSETSESARWHSDDAWEPEWIEYVYSCQLQCSNNKCKEVVVSVGKGNVNWYESRDEKGHPTQEWYELFSPVFFFPNLKIFDIPAKTPDRIQSELNQSFALLFANHASAANHVRIALEEILTDLKVRRFSISRGMRYFISLHDRIDLVPKKYESIKVHFFAIKWVGNAGSHSTKPITLDDVLDAYEIMEVILKEVYGKRERAIASLAKQINKKRGPKSTTS